MWRLLVATLAAVLIARDASADPLRLGFGFDAGIPSGGALGVVARPGLDWAHVEAAATYNYLSFGARGSVQVDPLAVLPNFPLGVLGDVQAGIFPAERVPGHSDLPGIGYEYLNLFGGVRFGKPHVFHWTIEAGWTRIHVYTQSFQSLVNSVGGSRVGLAIDNPTVDGWFFPTFTTGFEVVWPN